MKHCVVFLFLLMIPAFGMKAEVDPKFQIYLCFGQSNMSGGAAAEAVDMEYVDDRFQMLATDTMYKNPVRIMGSWYTAYPPIVSGGATVCPADYFGRSMVAALPADHRVGVLAVAAGGLDIRAFFPEVGEDYILYKESPGVAKYDCKLYRRLVDMAKEAQKVGVIKGILMHQGEANCGQPDSLLWPQWVMTIYESLINDLNLNANEVPLLVGEVGNASEDGKSQTFNDVIAQVPSVIPTAHVVSSVGCPLDASRLHFSASGYRVLGKRYAIKMLEQLGYPAHKDADYQLHESLRKFYKATSLESCEDIVLQPDSTYSIPITAYFEDGHSENVTAEAVVTKIGTGLTVNGNRIKATTGERSLVTVSYTDFTGETFRNTFFVNRTGSPLGMITDVVNNIMGTPSETFDINSADRNSDGVVNVVDLIRMISEQ